MKRMWDIAIKSDSGSLSAAQSLGAEVKSLWQL